MDTAPEIVELQNQIKFFVDHDLYFGIEEHQTKLEQLIKWLKLQIQNAIDTEKMNNIGQTVLDKLNGIIKRRD